MNISKRFKKRAKVWFLPNARIIGCDALVLDYSEKLHFRVNEFFEEPLAIEPRVTQSKTLMCQQVGRAVRYYIPRRR